MLAQLDHAEIRLGQIFTMLIACVAYVLAAPAYLIATEGVGVDET